MYGIEVRDWWKMYDPGRDGKGSHFRFQGLSDYRDFLWARDPSWTPENNAIGFWAKEWISSRAYVYQGLWQTQKMANYALQGGYTQRRGEHYPVVIQEKAKGLKAKVKRVTDSLRYAESSHTVEELEDGKALVAYLLACFSLRSRKYVCFC